MIKVTDIAGGVALDPKNLNSLRNSAKANSPEAIKTAAKQMESLFVNMMLKSMRQATPQDGPMDNDQTRLFSSMLDSQISQHVHVGLADMMIKQLSKPAVKPNPVAGMSPDPHSSAGGVEVPIPSMPKQAQKKDRHITPDALKPIFKDVESKLDLPVGLLEKMAFAESSWDTRAHSNKGASGLMQLMPGTAKRFHVDDPTEPKQAIEGAGRYMRWLLDRYGGNLEKAVAAYNAGEGNVDKYNGVPPFAETREYVKRVLKSV
ncbi:MAG: transglycosylase SLT domain-containing protein [Proteobacteria bacterium]|nr:transglycosylase SLT domain-containing protein [Pseudomonadota bacterium]